MAYLIKKKLSAILALLHFKKVGNYIKNDISTTDLLETTHTSLPSAIMFQVAQHLILSPPSFLIDQATREKHFVSPSPYKELVYNFSIKFTVFCGSTKSKDQ